MTARDEILGRVRGGLAKGDFATRRAQAEAYIEAQRRGPSPHHLLENFEGSSRTNLQIGNSYWELPP